MDIKLICNTSDAELAANIAASSRGPWPWLTSQPMHDGHAVLVGGGPSLADHLDALRRRVELGQTVFALNGAAGFLNRAGIVPDYQVILDARPETATLKARAQHYLIASQCHPDTFADLKRVTLWHANIDDIEASLPVPRPAYALVGGGPSVGLSAMNLAYVMGYRKLHLYGFDSSHTDRDHAYHQPQALRDPVCEVTVAGKTFASTLTMARQAELFPQVCDDLIEQGCVITVESDGLIRAMVDETRRRAIEGPMAEPDKYRMVWDDPRYRINAPGEHEADAFVRHAELTPETRVIDFGCGTGRGGKRIHDLAGCPVTLADFAQNAPDAANALPFQVADLTQPMSLQGDVGYCTDVMEHIPTEDVPKVIANIMACVPRCWFKIALFQDNMGVLVGEPLHLSVFPAAWWDQAFSAFRVLHRRETVESGDRDYLTLYVENLSQGA